MPFHLKVFSILLGVTLLVELVASNLFFGWDKDHPNYFIYNGFLLPEMLVYAWFYHRIIHIKPVKTGIVIVSALFILQNLYTFFILSGFYKWNAYLYLVSAVFATLIVVCYYFELLLSDQYVRLSKHSEFWIATGMLVFYTCQIPFFGSLNYLLEHKSKLIPVLFASIEYIDALMYGAFAYAYLCILWKPQQKYK